MKKCIVVAGVLSMSSPAWAAPPGVVLGAERVWGLSHSVQSFEGGGDSLDFNSVSLGGSPLGTDGVYSAPRLAIDYVAQSGFSFGGALGAQTISVEDEDSITGAILALRAGYFVMTSPSFGVWPRGGISYTTIKLDPDDDAVSYTALTLEVPLALFLVDSAALTITPHVDLGLGGGSDDVDSKVTEIGAHFGMSVFM
jgi:hypothetical protein